MLKANKSANTKRRTTSRVNAPALPKAIDESQPLITRLGRQFILMNELFLPANLADRIASLPHPTITPNDPTRPQSPAALEQSLLTEIYDTVPVNLHPLMQQYSLFGKLVSSAPLKKRN